MTNPLKGEMTLTLANDSYKARLTIDSIIKIETELDIGILALTQRLADADVRIHQLRCILLHALRGGGNDLKEKDITRLIEDAGLIDSCKAVAELLTNSLVNKNAGQATE